jgi:uncharacterized protein (DUF2236 family)
MPPLANSLIDRTKRTIVGEVRAVFNDRARGEKPVVRRPDGIFGQGSVIWRVHGDVTTMMVGGIAALLLQMLHPSVLAGVWDHSDFRHDMLGRLRRTARFIALTTYGSRDEADAAIERVRLVHERVRGSLPSGQAYGANDPHLLAWVHVTEATSFLDAWIRYGEPAMSAADQDRYFAEFARVAEMLGADPIPRTRREAHALMSAMRYELCADERTREVARLVLESRPQAIPNMAFQALIVRAAVDLLPYWARRMHRLRSTGPVKPLVRAGTSAVANTIRWAFH